jgi:hypothetical protein
VQDAVAAAKADEAAMYAQAKKPEPKERPREEIADNEQNPLDVATQRELAATKLAREAQALSKWAATGDDHLDTDCKQGCTKIEQVVPVQSEAVSRSTPGIAATAKAKVRKIVEGAKVVIKKVSEKVAAVQQSSAPTVYTAADLETAPQSKPGTADALRSAHKRASNWLPSRMGRSDLNAPLWSSTPA